MPRKRKSNLSQRSKNARRMKIARSQMTTTEAELKRIEQAERQAATRSSETPEQSELRRLQHAQYLATKRAAENLEQSQKRRLQSSEHMATRLAAEAEQYLASQRVNETFEEAQNRRRAIAETTAQLRQMFVRNTWSVFDNAAYEYDSTFNFDSHSLIKMERMNKDCRFCSALKLNEGTAGMCCSSEEVSIFSIPLHYGTRKRQEEPVIYGCTTKNNEASDVLNENIEMASDFNSHNEASDLLNENIEITSDFKSHIQVKSETNTNESDVINPTIITNPSDIEPNLDDPSENHDESEETCKINDKMKIDPSLIELNNDKLLNIIVSSECIKDVAKNINNSDGSGDGNVLPSLIENTEKDSNNLNSNSDSVVEKHMNLAEKQDSVNDRILMLPDNNVDTGCSDLDSCNIIDEACDQGNLNLTDIQNNKDSVEFIQNLPKKDSDLAKENNPAKSNSPKKDNFCLKNENSTNNIDNLAKTTDSAEKEQDLAGNKVDSSKKEVELAENEENSAKTKVGSAEKEVDSAEKELDSAEKELETAEKELDSAGKELDSAEKELDSVEKEVDSTEMEIDSAEKDNVAKTLERSERLDESLISIDSLDSDVLECNVLNKNEDNPLFIDFFVDPVGDPNNSPNGSDCMMMVEKMEVDLDPNVLLMTETEDDELQLIEKVPEEVSLLTSSDESDVILQEPHIDTVEVSDETDEDDMPLDKLIQIRKKSNQLKCMKCPYRANSEWDLGEHQKNHVEINIHVCPICRFQSASKYQFTKHLKRHKEEKIYKCPKCEYRARHKMSMVYHLKSHNSDSEPCEVFLYCDDENKKSKKVKKSVVSERKCTKCKFVTNKLASLTNHMKKSHKKKKKR